MTDKFCRVLPITDGSDDFWVVLDGPEKLRVLGGFYADENNLNNVVSTIVTTLRHAGIEPIERAPLDWGYLLNQVVLPTDVDDERWEKFLRWNELDCETPFLNWLVENIPDALNMGDSEEAQKKFIEDRCESVICKERD